MSDERASVDRGFRAQMAMNEFFGPAFDAVTDAYMARLAEIAAAEPWATDKIAKLAIAARVAREVRAQIDAVIMAGAVAKAGREQADKIARIPVERRRLMGLPV